MRVRDLKARAEEFEDQYAEAMAENVLDNIKDYLDSMEPEEWDREELEIRLNDSLDDITDRSQWCFDKVQSEEDDIGGAKYEAMRDEQIEKENR